VFPLRYQLESDIVYYSSQGPQIKNNVIASLFTDSLETRTCSLELLFANRNTILKLRKHDIRNRTEHMLLSQLQCCAYLYKYKNPIILRLDIFGIISYF
jgi:hypothetical protein